jgi:hypothetical protein
MHMWRKSHVQEALSQAGAHPSQVTKSLSEEFGGEVAASEGKSKAVFLGPIITATGETHLRV